MLESEPTAGGMIPLRTAAQPATAGEKLAQQPGARKVQGTDAAHRSGVMGTSGSTVYSIDRYSMNG